VRNAKGLIVRKPWINLILDGLKTWEMRSTHTRNTGVVYLIESGTGLIMGRCLLSGSHTVTHDIFNHSYNEHRIEDISLLDRWNVAWRLSGAKRLNNPVPYDHPQGAVTWVNLAKPFYE